MRVFFIFWLYFLLATIICLKILLLEKGNTLVYSNNISLGIERYYDSFNDLDQVIGGTGDIQIVNFNVFDNANNLLLENEGIPVLNYYEKYI